MTETTHLLQAQAGQTLRENMDSLLGQAESVLQACGGTGRLMLSRVFFSDISNQLIAFKAHPLWALLSARGCSLIQQAPLGGGKLALLLVTADCDVTYQGTPQRGILSWGESRLFWESRRAAMSQGQSLRQLTEQMFLDHDAWLHGQGASVRDNCVRTWLYVRDIDTNYAAVVSGRNDAFAQLGLTRDTHFIASTGIEGQAEAGQAPISIDFLSLADNPSVEVEYLHAGDFLNRTIDYGVAFERATALRTPRKCRVLVSGTASIDHQGQCLHAGDVLRQSERLFLNIDQLLRQAGLGLDDVVQMTVYLRDVADTPVVERWLQARFDPRRYLITYAPVCRPEWLVEVEAYAVR